MTEITVKDVRQQSVILIRNKVQAFKFYAYAFFVPECKFQPAGVGKWLDCSVVLSKFMVIFCTPLNLM